MIELKADDFENTIGQIIKVTKELNDATVAYDAGHPIMTGSNELKMLVIIGVKILLLKLFILKK